MLEPTFWLALLGIVWVDVLLSGDNAVVIAMACQGLPPNRRWAGMLAGAGVAVVLRVFFSFIASDLMGYPGLGLLGGLMLVYIAIKLALQESDEGKSRTVHTALWRVIVSIAFADLAMSSDNIMAIAALARGDVLLMAIGVLVSIPCVVLCSAIIGAALERFPVLVWLGAGLLGCVGGHLIADDPYITPIILDVARSGLLGPAIGVCVTIGIASQIALYRRKSQT